MKTFFAVTCLALLAGAVFVKSDDDFEAQYAAAAPGDDSNVSGTLELEIEDDDNTISYRANLANVVGITGVHLHLQGNSSGGLYGGPLVLALTNTTTANNQQPVPASLGPLLQVGRKNSTDLVNNPQRAAVQARMTELGLEGSPPTRPSELAKMINIGVIYTDVHSLERVSPEGVTRGLVRDADDDDDNDDIDTSASGATGSSDNESSSDNDDDNSSPSPSPDSTPSSEDDEGEDDRR